MPSEPSYQSILQDTLALLREIEAYYSGAEATPSSAAKTAQNV